MKKIVGAALLSAVMCLALAPALMAQAAAEVTAADVDLYIALADAATPEDKQKLMLDSGRDMMAIGTTQGKIGSLAAMYSQGVPDDQIKAAVAGIGVTEADIAVIEARKDDLIAAFKKVSGM